MRAALALVLVAGLSGCLTLRRDAWIGDTPLPATRDELYRLHGPPDAIRREGDSLWLRYDSSVTRGVMLGARATLHRLGAGLVLSRNQTEVDRVWVEVAPDGRVLSVLPLRGSDDLAYRLWPFGD